MTTNYFREHEDPKCPFYCKDSPIEVKCVGICGTHSIQVFQNKAQKESFMYDFCNSDLYGNCPQAIQISEDRNDE